jgi:hypothetical protein
MKYVVIYDDGVNVFNIIRGVGHRNARKWLKVTGGKHVRIYTSSGKFVTYGKHWDKSELMAVSTSRCHDKLPNATRKIAFN